MPRPPRPLGVDYIFPDRFFIVCCLGSLVVARMIGARLKAKRAHAEATRAAVAELSRILQEPPPPPPDASSSTPSRTNARQLGTGNAGRRITGCDAQAHPSQAQGFFCSRSLDMYWCAAEQICGRVSIAPLSILDSHRPTPLHLPPPRRQASTTPRRSDRCTTT